MNQLSLLAPKLRSAAIRLRRATGRKQEITPWPRTWSMLLYGGDTSFVWVLPRAQTKDTATWL